VSGGFGHPLDPRFVGLFMGTVMHTDDPDGVGRVRVHIPGLVEPASTWAYPIGTLGGGSDRSGFFAVPDKGADVAVLFKHGDINQPYYLSGHWGKPNGQTEVPDYVRQLQPGEAHQVRVLQIGRFTLIFDIRSGKENLTILDMMSGDHIKFKGPELGMEISTTSTLDIKAVGQVNIQALNVLVNGRPVLTGAGPI
jgi:hypothetical protein